MRDRESVTPSGIRRGLDRVETVAERAREATAEVLDEKLLGLSELDKERWGNHKEAHTLLAASLREYKSESNEWRSTLSDLRTAFLTKAEFGAEHRALRSDFQGDFKAMTTITDTLSGKVGALESDRTAREAADKVATAAHAEQQRREDAARARAQWVIGIAVAVISILVSGIVTVIVRVVTG